MAYQFKRKSEPKITRKAVQAALNAQRPLEDNGVEYQRKKAVRREWDESVSDIGETEK